MTEGNQIRCRNLGRTGIEVSEVAFGAGPVSELMTGGDRRRQAEVLAHAIARGVNWIDTAAGYGAGSSECAVGDVLKSIGAVDRVHIATKVRLAEGDLDDIPGAVRRSVSASLERLHVPRVTLLQLHNPVTANRGDEATSITVQDVLGPQGVLDCFRQLQQDGLVRHIGITAVGQPRSLREVIGSRQFDTIQTPYHVLNPSAGRPALAKRLDSDFGNVIELAGQHGMGVFVIRVLAAGALLDHDPSRHTQTSRFFTLDQYQRDRRRAAELQTALGNHFPLRDVAIRYALQHPLVSAAIIGFGAVEHVDQAIDSAARSRLPNAVMEQIDAFLDQEHDRSVPHN